MRSILQIGNDSALRTIRAAVLRLTGASVVAASSHEAMSILRREHFDLLIFCHTVSEQEREEISQEARKLHRDVPVLNVLRFSAIPSALNEASADPAYLLAKVNETLQTSPDEQSSR
jgi:DNA-binding NtrC family response regulator